MGLFDLQDVWKHLIPVDIEIRNLCFLLAVLPVPLQQITNLRSGKHAALWPTPFVTPEITDGTESGTQFVAKRYKTLHNEESAATEGEMSPRRKS